MASTADIKNGIVLNIDGALWTIIEFQHVKPGKGGAFVRTKMRNVITGGVTETTFNPTSKFENAFVDRTDMEYSYADGDLF
ncbi:MAG: elongation factor P, partial [Aurantimicrobium sp.]